MIWWLSRLLSAINLGASADQLRGGAVVPAYQYHLSRRSTVHLFAEHCSFPFINRLIASLEVSYVSSFFLLSFLFFVAHALTCTTLSTLLFLGNYRPISDCDFFFFFVFPFICPLPNLARAVSLFSESAVCTSPVPSFRLTSIPIFGVFCSDYRVQEKSLSNLTQRQFLLL